MKIFIDGGKRAAVSRMFPIWKKMGHLVVNNYEKADIQLSVIKIKVRKNLPTVLRLDGIYYDKAENYNNRNSQISKSHKIADAIIYQSYFSKLMCEKYLASRKTKIWDVIYNGIESWNNFIEHDDINIISCAKWRRWKRLPEIIEVFKDFQKEFPKSKLHILGPMKRGTSKVIHNNIIYYNTVDEEKIKSIYRTGDIFLHLAKKDWCPSTVVEAISSGIPVLTTNACGGATEMCRLSKGCIIINGEEEDFGPNYFYRNEYNKISNDIKKKIVQHMNNIVKNKIRLNSLSSELKIETTARKYLDIMKKII